MKLIAIILLPFALIHPKIFGQNQNEPNTYFFYYDITHNTSKLIKQKGTLIIKNDNSRSIFSIKKQSIKREKVNGKTRVNTSSNKVFFNFNDYILNTLVSKEVVMFNEYKVKEKTPSFNWTLIDSTNTIGNLKVKFAKVNFRGRKYYAWYSEKYPVKSGPWKFNGLPGLIVNVYDENRSHEWKLTKIANKSFNFKEFCNNLFANEIEEISLKEYVNKRYNDNTLTSKLKSKMPRGTKFFFTRAKRNGIELKYEWED